DFLVGFLAVNEPFVVVVQGDGQNLLGPVLSDDIGVELVLDFARSRNISEERLGDTPAAPLLVEDRLAELDAFAADVDISGTFHQRADVTKAFATERAVGVFLGAARCSRGHARPAVPLASTPRATPSDVFTRWHATPFHSKRGTRSS